MGSLIYTAFFNETGLNVQILLAIPAPQNGVDIMAAVFILDFYMHSRQKRFLLPVKSASIVYREANLCYILAGVSIFACRYDRCQAVP